MSIGLKLVVTGARELDKAMGKVQGDWKNAVAAAIYQKGFAIMADSVREVPVDKGRLRATHYVAPPTDIDNPVAELGYGTDYAVPVHEIADVHHPVGKDQFLRDPFMRHMPGYVQWIAARAKKLFARGTRIGGVPSEMPHRPKGT